MDEPESEKETLRPEEAAPEQAICFFCRCPDSRIYVLYTKTVGACYSCVLRLQPPSSQGGWAV